MPRDIVLQLETNEYEDEFFSSEKNDTNESELWQLEACEEIVSFLQKAGNEAKEYSTQHTAHKKNKSYHHSIYINGDRGTGKTVFLRNVENIWRSSLKTQGSEEKVTLFFCEIIDPTLLEMEDRFSDVIIATIYAAVDEKLKNCSYDEIALASKKEFFHSLKLLADSLGNKEEFNDLVSLDRIIKYRSGIQIEKYFHDFLKISTKILQCDAIVISIDDIDMKARNAFDVLDDIRRLMGCPYIIPLITGDIELYRYLCDLEFENNLLNPRHPSFQKDRIKKSNDLSKAYLTKVFPTNRRIELVSINNILSRLKIRENEKTTLKYREYKELIRSYFYFLCNEKEKSFSFCDPQNAREISQLIRLFPPSQLNSNNNSPLMWDKFKTWAEEHQDGDGVCNALSYIQLKNTIDINKLSLRDLISFNIVQQIESKYQWKSKDFYEQNRYEIEKESKNKNKNKNENENENKNFNLKVFNSIFPNKNSKQFSLRSMPVLEIIHSNLFVNKEHIKNNSLLLNIYTHHDYYSISQNKKHHILFSRAFEILSISIILAFEDKIEDDSIKKIIKNIFDAPPFYSIFSLNPTKMVDDSELIENSDNENEGIHDEEQSDCNITMLSEEIIKWINDYKLFTEKYNSENIVPLLSSTFNKIFTQLNILKNEKVHENSNESLFSIIKRFEYITINAFASFIKKENVINSNLAISANPEIITDFNLFIKQDNTLSQNLRDLIATPLRNKKAINNNKENIFIEMVWNHPLFNDDLFIIANNIILSNKEKTEEKNNEIKYIFDDQLDFSSETKIVNNMKKALGKNSFKYSNVIKKLNPLDTIVLKKLITSIENNVSEKRRLSARMNIGKIYLAAKKCLTENKE